MDIFGIGLTVLFVMTILFYIVLFSFIYYWHLKNVSYVVVPVVWTFEFFVIGFFVVALVSIILYYVPVLVAVLKI